MMNWLIVFKNNFKRGLHKKTAFLMRLLKKYTRNKYTFSFAQKYQKQRKNGIINIENIKVRDN